MSRIEINASNIVTIDEIKISEHIFDEELVDYSVRGRDEIADTLIDWIGECHNSDRELMKDDLKYLMNIDDEYIFSSISTNKYIALSDNETEYNEICEAILALHNKTI